MLYICVCECACMQNIHSHLYNTHIPGKRWSIGLGFTGPHITVARNQNFKKTISESLINIYLIVHHLKFRFGLQLKHCPHFKSREPKRSLWVWQSTELCIRAYAQYNLCLQHSISPQSDHASLKDMKVKGVEDCLEGSALNVVCGMARAPGPPIVKGSGARRMWPWAAAPFLAHPQMIFRRKRCV